MSKVNLSPITNLQNEVTAVTTINNNSTLITQAIENTISRDGTLPNMMNAELDMNSNKITNLPDAFTDQEPVTYGQFIDGITSVNNGVVVDGAFIMAEHGDTTINDRVLASGLNIDVLDEGPKGNVIVSLNDIELNALAEVFSDEDKLPYFTGVGEADVTDFTPFARTLLDDEDASTMRDTLGVTLGTDTQPHSDLLDSLNDSGNGLLSKTDVDTITPRTITGTSDEITVTNGDGVLDNPVISLPSSLEFTGKSVTGGSFNSPEITTPTGIVKGDVGLGNVDNTSDATKNAAVATLQNKTLDGTNTINVTADDFRLHSSADPDKIVGFNLSYVPEALTLMNPPLTSTNLIGDDTTDTLTNKSIDLASNTLTGTVSEFNTALSDGDFATQAGSETLTNKTIDGSDNTITDVSNASLSSVADFTIKSNISGSSSTPSDNTITAVLDKQFGTSQGTIAYRGASAWSALTPGTSGNFLKTQGSSANPIWDAIPGGGDLLSSNNLSDVADADTSRLNLNAAKNFPYTTQLLTSSGTYTPTTGTLWIEVHMVGGGGGGGGSGSSITTQGTNGGTSSFNGVNAIGGDRGSTDNGGNNGRGGNGGSGGTGTSVCRYYGGGGMNGDVFFGGVGGQSFFGGSGKSGSNSNGGAGQTNSGSGGGGSSTFGTPSAGGGGGAGEYVYLILPATSYSYTIGAGGAGGIGASNTGGAGGSGVILVVEHY